jgi:hypothetical protein
LLRRNLANGRQKQGQDEENDEAWLHVGHLRCIPIARELAISRNEFIGAANLDGALYKTAISASPAMSSIWPPTCRVKSLYPTAPRRGCRSEPKIRQIIAV